MRTAVMLMAYGSPRSLDEVRPYLRDIRGGREPPEAAVEDLTERYRAIGGRSPLLEHSTRQAEALQAALDERSPRSYGVGLGMKHWHPYIAEGVEPLLAHGPRLVIGVALAPHFSSISIGGYEQRLRAAVGERCEVRMVRSWWAEPSFVDLWASRLVQAGVQEPGCRVFFTAHSLPARILAEGDPYRDELLESSRLIAERGRVGEWELAFQSASETGDPWLGPDVTEALRAFAEREWRTAVLAPIGFVCDHLELLYDLDVECAALAREIGMTVRRVPAPNHDPRLVSALASVVLKTEGKGPS